MILHRAAELLVAGLAQTPGDPRLLINLGRVYSARGDLPGAIRAWEQACSTMRIHLPTFSWAGPTRKAADPKERWRPGVRSAIRVS